MKRPIKNDCKLNQVRSPDDYVCWFNDHIIEQEKYIDHLESVIKKHQESISINNCDDIFEQASRVNYDNENLSATSIEDFDPSWIEYLNTNKKL